MFMQPTIEKLYAMKLTGMADALRQQSSDSATNQLTGGVHQFTPAWAMGF